MGTQVYPKVTVIILNWNGKRNTHECLESLRRIDYPNYETIVVDNASTDGSQVLLKQEFPEITLIENEKNLGFGGGFNAGIKEAIRRNSDYVLCLNNDVVVDGQILNELVKIGELSTKIGGLCPMEYYYDEPNRIQCAGGIIRFVGGKVFGCGKLDKGQYNEVRETELLSGPAMMLKVNTLLDIGFFDQDYFYGPEDKDIALRATRNGYKLLFVPSAKLWHKHRGATGGKVTPLTVYFEVRNFILFLEKQHANKLEFIISILYFGFLVLPFTLLNCFLRGGGRQCVTATVKGIIWHLNRGSVLPDSEFVTQVSCFGCSSYP